MEEVILTQALVEFLQEHKITEESSLTEFYNVIEQYELQCGVEFEEEEVIDLFFQNIKQLLLRK